MMGLPLENTQIYIGYDKNSPNLYLHIYRRDKWPTESMRLTLFPDGEIVASKQSVAVWRKWVNEK